MECQVKHLVDVMNDYYKMGNVQINKEHGGKDIWRLKLKKFV